MSATGLFRMAWRQVWQKPGILVMAFWYLFITSLFQLFVLSRLGSALPQSFTHLNLHSLTATTIPHLKAALWVKIALVYLTLALIVFPFVMGGLYGAAAASTKNNESLIGLLRFFKFGAANFWRAFLLVVMAIAGFIVLFLVLWAITLVLSLISSAIPILASLLSIVALVLLIGVLMLWFALLLYWVGAVFYGEVSPVAGLGESLAWVRRHWGFALRFVLLEVAVLAVFLLVMTLLTAIPIVGGIAALVGSGIMLSWSAYQAMFLYREGVRHDIQPPL